MSFFEHTGAVHSSQGHLCRVSSGCCLFFLSSFVSPLWSFPWPSFSCQRRLTVSLKGATSRFTHLKKFSLDFSSALYVIRVNHLHPQPSLFLYSLLLSLWCFSILINYYFQVSFNLKVLLYTTKITQNTVTAPLRTYLVYLWNLQICHLLRFHKETEGPIRVENGQNSKKFSPFGVLLAPRS